MSPAAHPLVSIITPAHNSAAYLGDTILTALRQTYEHFELLVVDDGSTDGTADIARGWQRLDPRVQLIQRVNGGSSAARNTAMERARGAFFAFLDSDDLWQPDYLAVQMAMFDQHPDADVVTGNGFNLGGPFDGQPLYPLALRSRTLSLLDILEREDSVCIMSVFRRAVYDEVGPFDEQAALNEDYDYWIRAAHAGFAFVTNPEPLAYYRRHTDSKSADVVKSLTGIIRVFRRARILCADLPAECAAIDRQIERFEQQRLFTQAKTHLLRREFEAAARDFDRFSAMRHDVTSGAIAAVSRRIPRALLLAYHLKLVLRSFAPVTSRG